MHVEDPRFPPLLTGCGVKAPVQAFAAACQGAASGAYGAADVIWARNTGRVEMALVLEPDVPARRAREMVPLFQLAVIEAVGSLMPPKTSVLLRWPSVLLVNGGIAGNFRFAMASCDDEEVPDWMVAAIDIALLPEDRDVEPGYRREQTTLIEEGSETRTRSDFLEVISAFTLSWINSWQDDGIAALAESWVGRIEGNQDPALIVADQVQRGDEANGDDEAVRGVKHRVLGLSEDLGLLVKGGDDNGEVLTLPIRDLVETFAGIGTANNTANAERG